MTHRYPDDDPYTAADRDFRPLDYDHRDVVAYGADRHSMRSYFAWFIGAVAVIAMLLFATGFFGNQTRDQANNPSLDRMQSTTAPQPSGTQPSTTGQGSQ
jgi:hypothetical protein